MSVDIQELPPDQIEKICVLFKEVYGHPMDSRHWNWKYHQGPRLGSVNLAIRNGDGEWIGHIGASVFPGNGKTEGRAMAHISDIMVKREVRGGVGNHAVFSVLVRAMQTKLMSNFSGVFAYGFAGIRPFRLGERLGFYRTLYRCRTVRSDFSTRSSHSAMSWSANLGDWDDARLDRIWQGYSKRNRPLQVNRSGAYVTWRYRDHPDRSYELWYFKRLFRDVGWFVVSRTPDGGVQVIDALLPSPDAAMDALTALGRSMADLTSGVPRPIECWLGPAGVTGQDTPILAGEFKTGPWHNGLQVQAFQPGDTDVY